MMTKKMIFLIACLSMVCALVLLWSMSQNALTAAPLAGRRGGPDEEPRFLPNLTVVTLPRANVPSGRQLDVVLEILLQPGYHLNPDAPSRTALRVKGGDFDFRKEQPVKQARVVIPVFLPPGLTEASVDFDTTLYFCRETATGVCHIKSYRFQQPVALQEKGTVLELLYQARLEATEGGG